MKTIQSLLTLPADQLPDWIQVQSIIDDTSPQGLVVITSHLREYKYKPVFKHGDYTVSLAATFSLRQCYRLIYWYLRMQERPLTFATVEEMLEVLDYKEANKCINQLFKSTMK